MNQGKSETRGGGSGCNRMGRERNGLHRSAGKGRVRNDKNKNERVREDWRRKKKSKGY